MKPRGNRLAVWMAWKESKLKPTTRSKGPMTLSTKLSRATSLSSATKTRSPGRICQLVEVSAASTMARQLTGSICAAAAVGRGGAGDPDRLAGNSRQTADLGDSIQDGLVAGDRHPLNLVPQAGSFGDHVVELAVVGEDVDRDLGFVEELLQVFFDSSACFADRHAGDIDAAIGP